MQRSFVNFTKHLKNNRPLRQFLWIFLFSCLTYGLFKVEGVSYWFYDEIYSKNVFRIIRYAQGFLFGWVPFNLFFPLIISVLAYIGIRFFKFYKRRINLFTFLINIFSLGLLLISFFYWFWGFNYLNKGIADHLSLKVASVKESKLVDEINLTLDEMFTNRLENGIVDSLPYNLPSEIEAFDSILLKESIELFEQLQLPGYPSRNYKPFWPKGFLYRLGTVGFYNPYTGEANFESAAHPLILPFIKAHEWTHAQGITDEGDANFLAYLICAGSKVPLLRYSAAMEYFRYLIFEYRKINLEGYTTLMEKIPAGIASDLREIREYSNQYPEFMPKARDAIYTAYLKSHGVKEGLESYNRFINMIIAYKKEKKL
jgi:hypothetical protein